MKSQLKDLLVIDVTITKDGNDILDIINKQVTESDLKSKLEFHKYYISSK